MTLDNTDLLITLLAAFGGGYLGRLMKFPGGALVGSIFTVAAVSNYFDLPHTPPQTLLIFLQLLMGCMLGQSINRRFWQDILHIWRPTFVVVGMYTLAALPFAFFLCAAYGFTPLTAVFAATPARMQDMIILATSLDSDAITVMVMQMARLLTIITLTPFMLARFAGPMNKARDKKKGGKEGQGFTSEIHRIWRTSLPNMLILIVPGIIGGAIGRQSGHILGVLIGAFCAVAATRIIWLRAGETPFPKIFSYIIQSTAGLLLGVRITPATGALMLDRFAPLVTAVVYVVLTAMVIAYVLRKRYHWKTSLCWMSAAPGRTSDLLAVSQDIDELDGRDRLALACVHTVRQVYFTLLISAVVTFV